MIVGAFAIWRGYREEIAKHSLLWLASIFAFYIIAARTTSEDWAHYYHVFSIPPAALLFGFSIKKLRDYAQDFTDTFSRHSLIVNLSRVVIFSVVIAAIFASLLVEAKQIRVNFTENRLQSPAFAFAKSVKPLVKPDAPILVSGGHCKDDKGYYVAYNASYMFYWLERKGWNICVEVQSITNIREFLPKGVEYFVAEKKYVREKPGFEDELNRTFPAIADSGDFAVYDIRAIK